MKRPDNLQAYKTLTKIGITFGASAQQVGKVLTEKGYREPKTYHPTPMALEKKLAYRSQIVTGQQFWMWKAKDVIRVLENEGWTKLHPSEIQAKIVSTDVVKLLKTTSNIHSWHGKKACGLVANFADKSRLQDLQHVLESIEKHTPRFSTQFKNQYENVLLKKRLQEEMGIYTTQQECAPKSKL